MEDNKVRILKMLENGLISVEEAKDLLEASIEGKETVFKSKKKFSDVTSAAKNILTENKPKAKKFAINVLEKISDVSAVASKKLKNEYREYKEYREYRGDNEDKKFFVVEVESEVVENDKKDV